MRDFYHDIVAALSLQFGTYTATTEGGAVDLQGFDGALIVVPTGTITDGTHTITLLESDDDVTYTEVAAENILGSAPAIGTADSNKVFTFGYIGSKRYLKVKVTVAGATNGGTLGALVLKGYPRHAPVV